MKKLIYVVEESLDEFIEENSNLFNPQDFVSYIYANCGGPITKMQFLPVLDDYLQATPFSSPVIVNDLFLHNLEGFLIGFGALKINEDAIEIIDEAAIKKYNQLDYHFYLFSKTQERILSGWEYREDAVDRLKELDVDYKRKHMPVIVSKAQLIAKGMNPDKNESWGTEA